MIIDMLTPRAASYIISEGFRTIHLVNRSFVKLGEYSRAILIVFRELWRFHRWLVDWSRRIPGGEGTCFDTSWACLSSRSVYSSSLSLWFWAFRYRYGIASDWLLKRYICIWLSGEGNWNRSDFYSNYMHNFFQKKKRGWFNLRKFQDIVLNFFTQTE